MTTTYSRRQFGGILRRGQWQESNVFCMLDYPIRELSAMTLGIVGHGELGRGVERIAREFGMTVLIAWRPGTSATADDGRTDFQEMLGRADVALLIPVPQQAVLVQPGQVHRQEASEQERLDVAVRGINRKVESTVHFGLLQIAAIVIGAFIDLGSNGGAERQRRRRQRASD